MAWRIDPLLRQLDQPLDDERSQAVRADVSRRRLRTATDLSALDAGRDDPAYATAETFLWLELPEDRRLGGPAPDAALVLPRVLAGDARRHHAHPASHRPCSRTLHRLVTQAQGLLPLAERVIRQTRRRVLQGEKVPFDEKVPEKGRAAQQSRPPPQRREADGVRSAGDAG